MESVRALLRDAPNKVRDSLSSKVKATNNPYGEENGKKRDWVAELGFNVPTTGDTLYFMGCTAPLRIPEVAKNTARILHAAGDKFAILGDELCCGSVLLRTGMVDEAKENAKQLAEVIEASGAQKIIVSCAGCLKTLKKDFPEKFGIELPEVLHIVEYAEQLLAEGKLELHNEKRLVVTYHDPCHMGRELQIYDAPRTVISAVPNVELVEMDPNRHAAMCCGAGGGLRSFDPDLSKRIAADRMRTAAETGAEAVVTACPFCETNLTAGAEQADIKIRVIDIVDLLAKSAKKKT
jgi:heterodisulfide reductase subunit D